MKFTIINDVRLLIEIEADEPNRAVRIARDLSADQWQTGDQDEIEVYDEDGNPIEFDWAIVERLA